MLDLFFGESLFWFGVRIPHVIRIGLLSGHSSHWSRNQKNEMDTLMEFWFRRPAFSSHWMDDIQNLLNSDCSFPNCSQFLVCIRLTLWRLSRLDIFISRTEIWSPFQGALIRMVTLLPFYSKLPCIIGLLATAGTNLVQLLVDLNPIWWNEIHNAPKVWIFLR